MPGKVVHTVGWPLKHGPGGFSGGFLYHVENTQIVVGLIVDLSYRNPHISPFDEFQRYKLHPQISRYLDGGKRVSYGARAIVKGGLPALPKLSVPGGLLIGDDAGFLNMLKIKGSHTGMKSGMLAAETVFDALVGGSTGGDRSDRIRRGVQIVVVVRRTIRGAQRGTRNSQTRNVSRQRLHVVRSNDLPRSGAIYVEGSGSRLRHARARIRCTENRLPETG